MKTWLIRLGLLFFLVLITFSGCNKEKKIIFQGSADELIGLSKENIFTDSDRNSVIEVEGKVAWISYPKDGFNLNRCTVYLETEGCNNKFRKGNFVGCKFNNRVDEIYVGKKLKIRGEYLETNVIDSDIWFKINKSKIIDEFSSEE